MANCEIGHHAEALAAFDARHRRGRAEREGGIGRVGKDRIGQFEREGGSLGERVDAAALGIARMGGNACEAQPGAQEAAAAGDDAGVAGIAQRGRIGRPSDGQPGD